MTSLAIQPADCDDAPGDAFVIDYRTSANRKTVAPEGLGARTAHGFLWMAAQTVSSKFFTLGSQVVLAWLLDRGDFGLMSKAYAATAFPSMVYQIGVREVLVRRQSSFARWAGTAYWVSGVFGILSGLLMLACAPLAVCFNYGHHAFSRPETAHQAWRLVWMIALIAAAAPFTPLASVPTAELERQLRFRTLSVIAFLTTSGIATLSIILAMLHCGVYSIVLPWSVVGLIRWLALHTLSRSRPSLRPNIRRWRYLIGDSSIVMLARGLGTFVLIGDYLMLGRFHSEQALGLYYFAFNLSMQSLIILAINLEGVLFPALSKLRQDPAYQRQAFLRSIRGLALVGVPACLIQAALAAPAMHAVFQPKWYPSITVLQVLSIGMAFRIVGWPTFSMLLAQGRYRAMLLASAGSAVMFMTLVSLASALTTDAAAPIVMACVVALHFAIEAPIYLLIATGATRQSLSAIFRIFATPMLAGGTAAVLGMLGAELVPAGPLGNYLRIGVTLLVMVGVYAAGVRWLAPDSFQTVEKWLRCRLSRGSPSPEAGTRQKKMAA